MLCYIIPWVPHLLGHGLCYVLLCYAMICYVSSLLCFPGCFAMLCSATLCYSHKGSSLGVNLSLVMLMPFAMLRYAKFCIIAL